MWESVRSLEEGQLLMARVVEHFSRVHHRVDLTQVQARAEWAKKQANAIRNLLMEAPPSELTHARKGE